MKLFNYNTINCTVLGSVNTENLKEFANRMVNYFGVASYNENGIEVSATVTSSNTLKVTVNGESRYASFSGKKVSEGMGRSIYNTINNIINEEIEKAESESATEDFESDILFETTVQEVIDGETSNKLPESVIKALRGKEIEFVWDSYPFYERKSHEYIDKVFHETVNPLTYEELVEPICRKLKELENNEEYVALHDLDGVWIEEINLDMENYQVCIALGS